MLSTLPQLVKDVLGAIRIADVIDVVVVSMLTYTAITWVRKARSRFVFLGFAALVGLYFVARLLDMYLTLFLFQAGITIALLALVVIFQEEIRRAFERIATSDLLRPGRATPAKSLVIVDTLVEATSGMARTKTGALIALRGKEPLERHTTGGIPLGGRLSEPLLYSIFDPSSAGHDGAIVIENGLISRFAVHLPLSTRIKADTRFGTRHTAALGLSERSDALVVVVSEERGKISIAEAGELEQLDSTAELKQRIAEFLAKTAPQERSSIWQRIFAHNLGLKALSLGLAVVAWLLVFGQQAETVARTFSVPIVYRDVPDGWLLDEPEPLETRVTLSGSSRAFALIDAGAVRISIDGTSIKPGHQSVKITASHLRLPAGLTVHEIDPESVSFNAYQTVPTEIAVKPQLVGQLARGLLFKSVRSDPAKLRVMVGPADRDRLTSLRTEPLSLTEVQGTSTHTLGVIVPRGSRLARGEPTEVQVTLDVENTKP